MALQVHILTPKRQVFSGEAEEVRVPGSEGEFGVLPGHMLLLSLVKAGTCTIVGAKGETKFVVGRGFAEAGPDRVTVLADSAEAVGEVDKAKAAHDAQQAEQVLASADPASAEFALAREQYELAQARLGA